MTNVSRSFFGLLFLLALTGPSGAQDDSIRAAPKWDCTPQSQDPSRVVWKSSMGGSQTGAMGMGGGKILVGSNDSRFGGGSGGIVNALDSSGRLLWRARHPWLKSRVNDMGQAIQSQPCFDGKRAYYMSNRGELMCVDVDGFRDEINDGPFKDEKERGAEDVDIIWKIDLMQELGVFKREAGDVGNPLPSPMVLGDLVFCGTAHGIPADGGRADPKPPSFLAVHKLTGKVAWSSNAPGADIIYGQWSSPVHAKVNGAEQVIFPGGDGFLYGFEPTTGKQLWKLDCNKPGALDPQWKGFRPEQRLESRFGFVGKPVVHEEMLYVALNDSIEARVPLPLLGINLAAPGGQPRIVWQFDDPAFKGTLTSAAVDGGLLFVTDAACTLFALDAKSGREWWRAKLEDDGGSNYASPVVYRGRVYAAAEEAVTVFEAAREKKCVGRYDLDQSYPSTPQFAENQMFIAVGRYVYALRLPE
jgi:outer membrane protein assembly factor BamB